MGKVVVLFLEASVSARAGAVSLEVRGLICGWFTKELVVVVL